MWGLMLAAGHGGREGCGGIIGVLAHTLLKSWIPVAPAACEQLLLLLSQPFGPAHTIFRPHTRCYIGEMESHGSGDGHVVKPNA